MKKVGRFFDQLSNKAYLGLLLGYTLLIRLPFFFRDYVDRDESSFILMGQSWTEGHLPFTELWDVKPPLTFFFFALIIFFFGKSFIAIRLAGVALVVISSFFTYKIAHKLINEKIGRGVGLAAVILQSLFGSLQGVMSEHIAMAFFMPSIWVLLFFRKRTITYFLSGLLMGIVLMIKLNMAYAVLLLGLFLVLEQILKRNWRPALVRGLFFGAGIILIIGLTILPYFLNGLEELWWKSVIEAPLKYAGARQYAFLKIIKYILPYCLFLLWVFRTRRSDLRNPKVVLLSLAFIGILFSFVKSGRVNGHYLILLHPLFLILLGLVLYQYQKMLKKINLYIWPLLLLLIPVESYLEYANIVSAKMEKGSFFNGEGVDVPRYLTEKGISTDDILFFEYHIGYWVLNTKPPTKAATQPSNILKDEMFFAYENPRKSGMEELTYLMEKVRPNIVVTRKNRKVFDKDEPSANLYINTYLEENYKKLDSVDAAMIYQRLKSQ